MQILAKANQIVFDKISDCHKLEYQALCLRLARVCKATRAEHMRFRSLRTIAAVLITSEWAMQLDFIKRYPEHFRASLLPVLASGIDMLEDGRLVALRFSGDSPRLVAAR